MGCEGCSRIILLVFNAIFFAVGAVCLGVGIWVVIDGTIFFQLLANIPEDTTVYGSLIRESAYILIAVGGAIFLIAFFGCCGAWRKSKCLLIVYAVIISILLLLQVATLVTAYFFYDRIVDVINDSLQAAINTTYDSQFASTSSSGVYDYTPGNLVSKGLDAIQIEFECCGVFNYTDYTNGAFPPTCCPPEYSGNIQDLVNTFWSGEAATYETTAPSCPGNDTYIASVPGCVDSIKTYILGKSTLFIGIAAGTIGIQLLLVILASCYAHSVGKEENFA